MLIECACGCGIKFEEYNTVKAGHGTYTYKRKFLTGHSPVKRGKDHHSYISYYHEIIECKCGCGAKFERYNKWSQPREYISGHNRRGKHNPNSMNVSRYVKLTGHLPSINDKKLKKVFNIGE